MKVQMTVQISGDRNGAAWPGVGETIDVPNDEAVQLLESRLAVPAGKTVETADTPAPPETAAVKPAVKAKGK